MLLFTKPVSSGVASIAFGGTGDIGQITGQTLSGTYTVKTTSNCLIVLICGDVCTGADDVKPGGVTWAGTPMALAIKMTPLGSLRFIYFYYLTTANGLVHDGASHTVQVICTTSHVIRAVGCDYSGVDINNPIDTTNLGASTASQPSITWTHTTVQSNAWIIGGGEASQPPTVGTGAFNVLRTATNPSANPTIFDSNCPYATPGGVICTMNNATGNLGNAGLSISLRHG